MINVVFIWRSNQTTRSFVPSQMNERAKKRTCMCDEDKVRRCERKKSENTKALLPTLRTLQYRFCCRSFFAIGSCRHKMLIQRGGGGGANLKLAIRMR